MEWTPSLAAIFPTVYPARPEFRDFFELLPAPGQHICWQSNFGIDAFGMLLERGLDPLDPRREFCLWEGTIRPGQISDARSLLGALAKARVKAAATRDELITELHELQG
jgi:hypothetical protein